MDGKNLNNQGIVAQFGSNFGHICSVTLKSCTVLLSLLKNVVECCSVCLVLLKFAQFGSMLSFEFD